jgi:hypothetical protein
VTSSPATTSGVMGGTDGIGGVLLHWLGDGRV